MRKRKPLMTTVLGGACSVMMLATQASGQQQPSEQRSETPAAAEARTAASQTLHLPADQPIVVLTVQAPSEVRVGQSFNYQIRVQNNSKTIAVHDLVIAQLAGDGFEIESAEVQGETSPLKDESTGQRQHQSAEKQRQSEQNARADAQDDKQRKSKNEGAKQDEQSDQPRKPESDVPESKKSEGGESQNKPRQSDRSDGDGAPQEETKDEDKEKDANAPSDQAKSVASSSTSAKGDRSANQAQNGMSDGSSWKIDRLMPGQSRTIVVTASSDSERSGNVCVAVESYMPSVCLTTRFTKPELEIVKQAPEVAYICDEITFDYLVRNTGTGDLQRFTVRDELPEGLQTVDGDKSLEFTLNDGLKAGGTRKFEARLRATKTGEFTSRATVEGSEGVEARSNRAGTTVQKADLALAIEGPRAQEVGGLANYTVRVTNRGDAPAPGTQLRVYFPRSADLVRAGQPQRSSRAVDTSSSHATGSGDQPSSHQHQSQPAERDATDRNEESDAESKSDSADASNRDTQSEQDRQAQQQRDQESEQGDDQQKSDADQQPQTEREQQPSGEAREQTRRAQNLENQERRNMAQHHWQLGTLAPGQTIEVTYVLRPYEGGELEQAAVAEYVCATAQDREMLRAETETATEILMLAGLRLTAVDDRDPVPAGENVTYTIAVLNQGNAPAHNVEISAKLPKGLKFVEAKGASAGEHSENGVTFAPVEALEPGKRAVWQLVANVNEGVGETTQDSIEVTLDSDDLQETITSEEPTTFFQAEKRTARSSDAEAEATEKK